MRYFFILLFLFCAQYTYSQRKVVKDTLVLGDFILTLTDVEKQFYDSLPSLSCRMDDPDSSVLITHDSLVFHLRNGGTHSMVSEYLPDSDDMGPGTIYYYEGSIKELDCWVVGMSGYETGCSILVGKEDGVEHMLEPFCSVPVFSPDKKYVVYGNDNGNIDGTNRIYLYRFENGQMTEGGSRINGRWGPVDVKWKGGHILYARVFEDASVDRYVRIDW